MPLCPCLETMIVLPRQAEDRHEDSWGTGAFLCGVQDNVYLASPGEGAPSFRMLYVDGYTGAKRKTLPFHSSTFVMTIDRIIIDQDRLGTLRRTRETTKSVSRTQGR